ncbi:sensor histidine kinase [Pedobacter insulae]|uniref:GHKL domain-containing protein n=1 Tax=Pedobacter insulae TaxID=414048 RepID=A0A1I3A7F3_9SPHI|nr:histidine kinase [Pedobacter insulae]SFH45840.1 GHKL domain-containing protein [Pedobacter insulae]
MTKNASGLQLIFKYQEFILFIGLILWVSIFRITEARTLQWADYLSCVLVLGINQLPVLVFSFNKADWKQNLAPKQYVLYWLLCFVLVQPVFTVFCISLATNKFDSSLFITSSISALALELLLIVNSYYQKKAKDAKWLKKIGLEKAVLISLILISFLIAVMGVSSLNNPAYHNEHRLLIGFEFSLEKVYRNFGTFLIFFAQFLLMYLCGYLFFIINSRILVSQVLKQRGLLLYILSVLATIVFLYPVIAQLLISLPINKTLGRDIFSDSAFDLENAFGVFGVMLFSLPIVLAIQWGNQNTQILSLEKQKSQTELDLLKQQLNPHFFFNTLNNLYGLSLQRSEKTSDSILQLAELMRYTIYKGQQDYVDLIQEINYIEDYVQLQQIRLKKPLLFNFDKHIIDENLQIAPLLLIVLIENAFKHGIETAENQSFLTLQLKSDQKKLYFSCENSFEEENSIKTNGIGLTNLQKRLALLYPERHSFEITKTKSIYRAELTLSV